MKTQLLGAAAAALLLGSCITAGTPQQRGVSAESLARNAGMSRQSVAAGPFTVAAFSRIKAPGQPVRVYIEGDGLAWMGRYRPSADPTPTDPVALRLAGVDPGPNVIYLARPCQFESGPACNRAYWTDKRFAPEVINGMNTALDEALRLNGVAGAGVELVGFSGGGAVAALLAARRSDVKTIRTVAGNLDHRMHSNIHNVSVLQGSLNPPDVAEALRSIPQRHFTGAQDRNVTAQVYESYARALGPSPCVHHSVVRGAAHESGWVAPWAMLLREYVGC